MEGPKVICGVRTVEWRSAEFRVPRINLTGQMVTALLKRLSLP